MYPKSRFWVHSLLIAKDRAIYCWQILHIDHLFWRAVRLIGQVEKVLHALAFHQRLHKSPTRCGLAFIFRIRF